MFAFSCPTWKMGSYWVGSANIVHPVDISFLKTSFSLSFRTTEAGLSLEVRRELHPLLNTQAPLLVVSSAHEKDLVVRPEVGAKPMFFSEE